MLHVLLTRGATAANDDHMHRSDTRGNSERTRANGLKESAASTCDAGPREERKYGRGCNRPPVGARAACCKTSPSTVGRAGHGNARDKKGRSGCCIDDVASAAGGVARLARAPSVHEHPGTERWAGDGPAGRVVKQGWCDGGHHRATESSVARAARKHIEARAVTRADVVRARVDEKRRGRGTGNEAREAGKTLAARRHIGSSAVGRAWHSCRLLDSIQAACDNTGPFP